MHYATFRLKFKSLRLVRVCCIDWEKSIEVKLLKIFFSSENEPQDFKLRSLLSCSVLFEICQAADFLQFAESTFSFDDNFKPISTNIYERIVYVRPGMSEISRGG